jgi:hypothetical protein
MARLQPARACPAWQPTPENKAGRSALPAPQKLFVFACAVAAAPTLAITRPRGPSYAIATTRQPYSECKACRRAGRRSQVPSRGEANRSARDQRATPVMLVVIAYRCTRVGKCALLEADLRRLVQSGLGKNAARRAIAGLKRLGWIKRWQEPGPLRGIFGMIREELTLPSEDKERIVWRAWFDGTLRVEGLAALIYLRAGAGKGGEGPTVASWPLDSSGRDRPVKRSSRLC